MARRLVGSVLFLGVAIILFSIAGRLASVQRAGWGWFLFAGLMISGVALNLWTAEVPKPGCSLCRKPRQSQDFE